MRRLPEHKKFFTVHGKKATTLADLKTILVEMSESEFGHHVSGNKNDYAVWVRDILHKDSLANRLEKVSNKDDFIHLVTDELKKDRDLGFEFSLDFKRFMAREFIYGMFLGLIIGLVAGRFLL